MAINRKSLFAGIAAVALLCTFALTPLVAMAQPGIDVSIDSTTLEEGQQETYTVVLAEAPTSDVTVQVRGPGLIFDAGGGTLETVISLTFTPADWDTPQDVTMQAVDDSVVQGDRTVDLTHEVLTGPGTYLGLTTIVPVTITDNDTGGLLVAQTGGSTDVTEGDPTGDVIGVRLVSAPQPGEVVQVTASFDNSQVTVSPVNLAFDSDNWDTPQNLTITGVADGVDEGPHTSDVVLGTFSENPAFNDLSETVTVNITDGEVPNLLSNGSFETAGISEAIAADWTVLSTAQPLDRRLAYPVTQDGDHIHVFQLEGEIEGLIQVVSVTGSANDEVNFSVYFGGVNVSGGVNAIRVITRSGGVNQDVETCLITEAPTTTFQEATCNFTASTDFDQIQVAFGSVGVEAGIIGWDAATLNVNTPAP